MKSFLGPSAAHAAAGPATPTPPALTLERATAINSAMVAMALEREGLGKVPLNQITLLRETRLITPAGEVVIPPQPGPQDLN